jgi:hemerythrin
MKWSDEFATGLLRLDEQHKMLFKMVEDYREALDEGHGERVYDLLLQSLEAYVRAHFSAEEECMTTYACPAAKANAAAHADFVVTLSEFRERYRTSGFDRVDARNLVDTLDRWLADHICKLDVRLKPYVEGAPLPTE